MQIKARGLDSEGEWKVVAKEEIKEHLGRSANFGDTQMIRMSFEINRVLEPSVQTL